MRYSQEQWNEAVRQSRLRAAERRREEAERGRGALRSLSWQDMLGLLGIALFLAVIASVVLLGVGVIAWP